MGIYFKWNKPIDSITNGIINPQVIKFAGVTWNKLYDPFVPMDTGVLAHDDIQYEVHGNICEIHHTAPYSSEQYYGKPNKGKEKHPLASMRWDEAAKSTGKKEILVKDVQAFIDRG